METEVVIELSVNQAAALRGDIQEISQLKNQLESLINVKVAASNRHADTIIKDAGHTTDLTQWNIEKRGGRDVLVLKPADNIGA